MSKQPPDLTPEKLDAMRKNICGTLGWPESRLKSVTMFDPVLEGRTGIAMEWEPKLSKDEEARVIDLFKNISAALGASPPIVPAKA